MFERVLVGYRDSEQGRDALELGRVLSQANRAEMLIATAPGESGEDLAQLARKEGADLVVIGSTRRGPVGRVVPGSMLHRLLADAPCAVAVAPSGFGRRSEHEMEWRPLSGDLEDAGMRIVGVGYDGSRAALEAVKVAADLAIPNGAALRIYTVAPKQAAVPAASGGAVSVGMPTEAQVLNQALHDLVAALPSEARALPVFMRGNAAGMLLDAVKLGVDLLVLGSRRGGPLRRGLRHGVTNAVLTDAPCPILISPTGVKAPVSA